MPNVARPGHITVPDRIGEAAHVIIGQFGDRPGPPPEHIGPPPVAAEPPALAPPPDDKARR
jgi:hypothetical protein